MRRILIVVLVAATMAALSASPAMAQGVGCWWAWSPEWGWFLVCDEPVTPWWWDGAVDGVSQTFEQEAESGDIALSYQVS